MTITIDRLAGSLTTAEWLDIAETLADAAQGDDTERLQAIYERVGLWAGTGEPDDADAAAETYGHDYIAATTEGCIVAWGAEHVLRPGGSTWREDVVE